MSWQVPAFHAPRPHWPCPHTAGQFGTRLQGGKDAASPRYIFTRLAPLTRHLFNEHDDRLLAYLNEEGQSIEPEWCVGILSGLPWGGWTCVHELQVQRGSDKLG